MSLFSGAVGDWYGVKTQQNDLLKALKEFGQQGGPFNGPIGSSKCHMIQQGQVNQTYDNVKEWEDIDMMGPTHTIFDRWLYINGLLWKIFTGECHNSHFPPPTFDVPISISNLDTISSDYMKPTDLNKITFSCLGIRSGGDRPVVKYNVDDPNLYIDVETKELRTRLEKSFPIIAFPNPIVKVPEVIDNSPIESRFEILDL